MLRSIMQRFESIYFQYEAGILDQRNWEVRRNWLAGWLQNTVVAEWWESENDSSIYTQEFIQDIESIVGKTSFGVTGQKSSGGDK